MLWRGIALACLPLAGLLSHATAASAQSAQVDVDYEVMMGGFDVARMSLGAHVAGNAYQVRANLRTVGLPDLFMQANFNVSSDGVIDDGKTVPHRFVSRFSDKDSERIVTLTYSQSGDTLMDATPPYDDGYGPDITESIRRNTQNPASALLAAIDAAGGDPCNRVIPVFDGRRRYDLKLVPDGSAEFTPRDGSYTGPVIRCRIAVLPVAGYKRKRAFDLLRREDSTKVWLAPFGDGTIYVPVRLEMRTPFGAAVARAVRFRDSTQNAQIIPSQ